MGEQRHYRRPSQHKRRPPQTVMPCGPEDTPERQSEHRAETEKQPPRQPRKRLVQKPTPKSRQNRLSNGRNGADRRWIRRSNARNAAQSEPSAVCFRRSLR